MGLTRGARGAKIGAVTAALKDAMDRSGTSFDERAARMILARHILNRRISSYNELSDDELSAVERLAGDQEYIDRFVRFNYGWTDELL